MKLRLDNDAIQLLRGKASALVALQPMLAHHPGHALFVDRAALRLADLGSHAAPAIAASMPAL
jgi:hypothetical protein